MLVAASAFAQTTASLSGTATTDGAPLPGVTVTISSPSMQGTRTAITGDAGGYNFSGLPPGEYTVRFDLAGMQPVHKTVRIGVGQSGSADANLKVAAVEGACPPLVRGRVVMRVARDVLHPYCCEWIEPKTHQLFRASPFCDEHP